MRIGESGNVHVCVRASEVPVFDVFARVFGRGWCVRTHIHTHITRYGEV